MKIPGVCRFAPRRIFFALGPLLVTTLWAQEVKPPPLGLVFE